MHPDDPAALSQSDGTTVRAWNDLGEVHLKLAGITTGALGSQ